MGCLIEFLGELVFEILGECYLALMSLIVPHKVLSESTEKRVRTAVKLVAGALLIVLIVGAVLFFSGESAFKTVGGFMTFIPLVIIVLQIVLGIIVRVLMHFKKRNSDQNDDDNLPPA